MAAGQQGGRMLAAKHVGFLEWKDGHVLTLIQEIIRAKRARQHSTYIYHNILIAHHVCSKVIQFGVYGYSTKRKNFSIP